jgi:hypothetical protein
MKLSKLCRTAIVPGARRVPLHEPIKLAEVSSSARLALDPANPHANATRTPNAAKARIPRVHNFLASETLQEIGNGKSPAPLSRQYIFDLDGLGKDFKSECCSIIRPKIKVPSILQKTTRKDAPQSQGHAPTSLATCQHLIEWNSKRGDASGVLSRKTKRPARGEWGWPLAV